MGKNLCFSSCFDEFYCSTGAKALVEYEKHLLSSINLTLLLWKYLQLDANFEHAKFSH